MASRTTRSLSRRFAQMLVRIEELEQQLSALRGRLADLEAQRDGDQPARPLPPAVPESKPRIRPSWDGAGAKGRGWWRGTC